FGVEFPAARPKGTVSRPRPLPRTFIAAGTVLVIFVIVALFLPRPKEIIPSRASFAEFPMRLPGWTGQPETMESIYIDQLKLDDYLMADYVNGSDRRI